MKRVYWRPRKVSRGLVILIGVLAVGGAFLAERWPLTGNARDHGAMVAAAGLAEKSFHAIRSERLARGHEFTRRFDPGQSGMIGCVMSAATSLPANLEVKQTSVNPNFAAVVVDMLVAAGARPGDRVAIGCTGSFPAFNVCVYAAIETLHLRPTVIHSVSSSQFGANVPDMLWVDMEKTLYDQGLISFRSELVTLGGYGDRAAGTSRESRQVLLAAIDRCGVRRLDIHSLAQSIDARVQYYRDAAAGEPFKAYINIGGGAASIRGSSGKAAFDAGVNDGAGLESDAVDCVAARFHEAGTPVIHLADAVELARRYHLPVAPTTLPAVATRGVHTPSQPNRPAAGLVLCSILITLRFTVWTDRWQRTKAYVRESFRCGRNGSTHLNPSAPPGAELSV